MKKIEYKITTIIPVYNAEKYLKTSIDSIINQTIGFENIELIIINDNSSDGSKEIIEEYSNKYENIVDIHLDKNSGLPGKPRNIGIKYARSPYLIFLDADDEYLPNAFEIYYNTIIQEKSDFVMSSHYWNMSGDKRKIDIINDKNNIININPMLNEENFKKSTQYHVSPWGKIFDKQIINDNNIMFLENALSEDAYFYYKTVINSKKITFLPNDILFIYNVYDANESTIHTHNLKTFNNFLNGFVEVMNLLKAVPYTKQNIIQPSISSLLLLFTNLSVKYKKENINKLYELEQSLDEKPFLPQKELEILNNAIMNRNYSFAIIISEIYSILYNNNLIRKLYRKFRHIFVNS